MGREAPLVSLSPGPQKGATEGGHDEVLPAAMNRTTAHEAPQLPTNFFITKFSLIQRRPHPSAGKLKIPAVLPPMEFIVD
mmetsp:Transcript_39981/g.88830  ORF Transcript_39981/g.88830 Transcript_39981/m.88830 type:complete len:80 (-) Transcript_39981:1117-1356(-)